MTAAEFRVAREWLGLSSEWLAAHLGVSARTIRHWEAGRHPIPDGVRLEIEHLEMHTREVVGRAVDALASAPDSAIVTYRSDAAYRAAHPGAVFPASWHRRAVARAVLEVPGLRVVYQDQEP